MSNNRDENTYQDRLISNTKRSDKKRDHNRGAPKIELGTVWLDKTM